ncbi:hypothetical protein FNF27_02035 [Cafeteria roenbergensis]|uniref:Uncharacterized protein n=1 Tax=Cafeteria roenbergensis TaxID=33653 RepID=A0A5A8D3H1_CAFRO|nr:hypothetical protein FNF31_05377 [Cafeteria roenbergensis]KAA0163941.1 hypothetical protein FNF28_04047 [Cafeteria roenbergensis]KAA0176338.1 hypothetical protein FNF27_02035 [Cafeteria roenbergensis]
MAAAASSLPAWATSTGAVAAGAVVLGAAALYGARQWAAGGKNIHHPALTGKVALITGANTGIGLETAQELARLGARVIVAGRSADKVKAAAAKVQASASSGGGAEELIVDLSDRASVERAAAKVAETHSKLDLLVNNAGIMFTVGRDRTEGPDGFEEQFQTNVIGHVLLTEKLLPLLEKAGGSPRVINVASLAHESASPKMFEDLQSKDWKLPMTAYGNSKLGNMLHARALNARLVKKGSRVRAYSLHPGVVNTELVRNSPAFLTVFVWIGQLLLKSPWEGAQTSLHLCLAPDSELTPGAYYADCKEASYGGPAGLWTDERAETFLAATEAMARTGIPQDRI